jgi:hypothetical protein
MATVSISPESQINTPLQGQANRMLQNNGIFPLLIPILQIVPKNFYTSSTILDSLFPVFKPVIYYITASARTKPIFTDISQGYHEKRKNSFSGRKGAVCCNMKDS